MYPDIMWGFGPFFYFLKNSGLEKISHFFEKINAVLKNYAVRSYKCQFKGTECSRKKEKLDKWKKENTNVKLKRLVKKMTQVD